MAEELHIDCHICQKEMPYGDKTEPVYIFLGEATDVKETPPDPITYRACENRNCSFNQVVVIDFDNYQRRYCHVCSLPHSDAKKCVDKEVDNADSN